MYSITINQNKMETTTFADLQMKESDIEEILRSKSIIEKNITTKSN